MKLHSPAFEKALRRGVRSAVRSSPELKRQYRRAGKYRRQFGIQLILRPGISIGIAILVWQMADERRSPASALALLNLWAFAFIAIQAQRLLTCLFQSRDLTALSLLPVPSTEVFRWEVQKFFRSAGWSLLDLVAGYAALGVWMHPEPVKWLAVALVALLAWGQTIALAAMGVIFLPRVPYFLVSNAFMLIIFVLFMARSVVGDALVLFLEQCAPVLNLALPTGWPAELFQLLTPERRWLALGLLVPLGGVLAGLRPSLARIRASYQFGEPTLAESPDLVPGADAPTPTANGGPDNKPQRLGPTEIEDIIVSRRFLTAPAWQRRGWLEGWLWRRLSERERILSEFVFPSGVAITSSWRSLFRNVAITAAGALLATRFAPGLVGWLLGVGLFIVGCQALALVLGTGRAFQPVACSGVNIPIYAAYGIGFRELGRLLFKVSLAQLPLLAALCVLSSLLVAYVTGLPMPQAVPFGIKAAALLCVSRLLFIVFAFSSGTNDTTLLRLRAPVLFGLVVICCVVFAALAGVSLFVPNPLIAWSSGALAALDAYAFYRLYGWFYNTNRFDLMSQPRG